MFIDYICRFLILIYIFLLKKRKDSSMGGKFMLKFMWESRLLAFKICLVLDYYPGKKFSYFIRDVYLHLLSRLGEMSDIYANLIYL